MKAYCISGLGADHRVFHYLKINYEMIHLDWVVPLKKESLIEYSKRLAKKIDQKEPFVLIGVSFGGVIAVEISKIVHPKTTILISSVQTSNELPNLYSIAGRLNLIKLLLPTRIKPPLFLMRYLFGTKHPLLKDILEDTDLLFLKWAIQELLDWKNTERLSNLVVISGSKDLILSAKRNDFLIEDGHHFMIVDKADQISTVINSL